MLYLQIVYNPWSLIMLLQVHLFVLLTTDIFFHFSYHSNKFDNFILNTHFITDLKILSRIIYIDLL